MPLVDTILRCYLILILLTSALGIWKPKKPHKEILCKLEPCQRKGATYLENIDPRVHPCQDFYRFACGRWLNHNPRPRYKPEWSVGSLLVNRGMKKLRELLENAKFMTTNKRLEVAKQAYDICIKMPWLPRKSAEQLSVHLFQLRGYPAYPLWVLHNKYLQLTGESAFFDPVIASYKLKAYPVLLFREPRSAYGSILHDATWKPQEEQAYLDFLFLLMKSVNPNDSDKEIKEKAARVLWFRKKFHEILRKNKKILPDRFAPKTPSDLDNSVNTSNLLPKQKIPWVEISEILLYRLPNDVIHRKNVVQFRQAKYFRDLLDLFADISELTIADHMEIYFLEKHVIYTDEMLKLLEATSIEPHSLLQYIILDHPERWEKCLGTFNAPDTLAHLYAIKSLPHSTTPLIEDILENLKKRICIQLDKASWLDTTTKRNIHSQLNTVQQWIATVPWITNSTYRKPPNAEVYDPLIPTVHYQSPPNVLFISAPFIAPPLFDPIVPALYNYAAMGSHLAHELYHILHDCGVVKISTAQETTPKVVWPPKTRTQCRIRKKCFVNQFNILTKEVFENYYNLTDVKVDTTRSFTENYPDVMGVIAAYKAYKMELKENMRICQTLPSFTEFSCDQMFFLTYANSLCEFNSPKAALDRLEHDSYSVHPVRVNGALINNKYFAAAFDCPMGSPMNPERKCTMVD